MSTSIAETLPSAIPPAFLEGEIRQIPLDRLRESPWNPRQYYPEAAMAELVASMQESGFRPWLPIMTRPLPDGFFEIGAGHRRSRAAREAGLKSVPCIVRDMTDEQFLDVLNFDNCGREDVHPLHEAAGWSAWMEKTGKGVADIAARIGQSKEYVYQRLKYSALAEPVRKAFIDGDITAGHAILIAHQQPAEQLKSLKYCIPDNVRVRPSVRDLQSHIKFNLNLDLEEAPFDLASDVLVPSAGTCLACPKQTKNTPPPQLPELAAAVPGPGPADEDDDDYMSDEELDDEEFPKGQCMDPGCFKSKVDAHLVQIKLKIESKGKFAASEVVDVSTNWKSGKKGPLGKDRYDVVAENATGATPAVVVDGQDAGKVVYVKVKAAAEPPKRPSWEEDQRKRQEAEKKRAEKAQKEIAIRVKILEAIRAKITGDGLTRNDVQPILAIAAGRLGREAAPIAKIHGITGGSPYDAGSRLGKAVPAMGALEFARLIFEVAVASEFDEYATDKPAEKLNSLAKRFKVDFAKIRTDAETAAKEAEGGTRREVEKPADSKPNPPAKKKAAAKAATKKKSVAKKPAKK